MKKKKSSKVGILVAILLLAVGFAAVTTTLYINGTAKIVPDEENFISKVKFDNDPAVFNCSEGSLCDISADGKTLTFTSAVLKNIGETAEINFRIVNESSYDAQLGEEAVVCTQVSSFGDGTNPATVAANDEHISIVASDSLNGDLIPATTGKSDNGKITVTMTKSYIGDDNDEDQDYKTIKFQCKIAATAVEVNN